MNVLHVFISLTEDMLYYERILKLNSYFPQYIISCDKQDLPNSKFSNFFRTKYFNFPKIEFLKNYFYTKESIACYRKNLSNVKFDLIHSYFAYPCASAGQQLAEKLEVPHIVTVRGSDVLVYPKQSKYLNAKITQNLKKANLVICVSKHLMQVCIEMGVDEKKLIHLPDGHNTNYFFIDPKVKKENFILFAGNLISVKNPLKLISAFKIISKNQPNLLLKIAGSGALQAEMQKMTLDKGIENKVIFLGQISQKELGMQMQKAKLLVLPSLSEGWGNVLQESLACGTPVVASAVGGIPEIISEGENGFFCNPHSEQDIAEKILKALNYPWDNAKLKIMPSFYTREIIIEKTLQIYQNIISK